MTDMEIRFSDALKNLLIECKVIAFQILDFLFSNFIIRLRVRAFLNALVVDFLQIDERFGGFLFQPVQDVKDSGALRF